MQRYGHKLTITPVGKQLIATCECGKWRRAVPVSDHNALIMLVGELTAKHDRHLDRLGRPVAPDASADAMPALPDEPEK
jgi:hypothetical protein